MTDLERAARAAAVAVGDDPDREGEPITAYIDLARAVLMAVRSPGPVVLTAVFAAMQGDDEDSTVKEGWKAGIDAILNEGQP